MANSIAKCGCDCFNCPTYKNNIRTIEERHICSSGWEKFLNLKLSPEKLRECDGCSLSDSERKIFYLNCKIRKCAMINEIENCAYCSGFPCDELFKAHSVQKINNCNEFTEKTGKEISENDFEKFIEPYTGIKHLNKIRQSLSDKDFKRFSSKTKFVAFNSEREILRKLYTLLTTISIENNIPFARLLTIESKREQLIRILWVTGCYGSYNENKSFIDLDSFIYSSQKINGMYQTLIEYINEFKKFDINCDIIPLVEKGWLTPMGGLRKEGWIFRLKFGDTIKGAETLKIFIDYVRKLNDKFGDKAYNLFNKADLSVLLN